ncbi:MAG TPA: hypothetical protein DE015_14555 [Oceanospirillales bacterium]|jgi:hypothetical protein|nr:hypothetical protein [Oceanospirillales bacterium]
MSRSRKRLCFVNLDLKIANFAIEVLECLLQTPCQFLIYTPKYIYEPTIYAAFRGFKNKVQLMFKSELRIVIEMSLLLPACFGAER